MPLRSLVDRLRGLLSGPELADTLIDKGLDITSPDGRRLFEPVPHACGGTDVGLVRKNNEDMFHVSHDGRLLIVADGMGGHMAGEVASAIAVDTLAQLLGPECLRAIDAGETDAAELFLEVFQATHRRVLDAARARAECRGMGTTLIAGYTSGDVLYTCHVGDVRCYIRTSESLVRITEDHSVIEALVRSGKLTAAEAREHPRRNEILQAVGMETGIAPDVHTHVLRPGDIVLLCSDGLWEMVPEEDIASVIDSCDSARECVVRLLDRANQAGGRDNITAVLYRHGSDTEADDSSPQNSASAARHRR